MTSRAFVESDKSLWRYASLFLDYVIGSYYILIWNFTYMGVVANYFDSCTSGLLVSSICSLCRYTTKGCLKMYLCCMRVLRVFSSCVMLWYECNDWSNKKHRTFTLNIDTTAILPELVNAHGRLRRAPKSTQGTRVHSRIPG